MTGLVPAMPPGQPSRADLAGLIFRILYQDFDLHTRRRPLRRRAERYLLLRRAQPGRDRPPDQRRVSTPGRPFRPRPAPPGRNEHMTSIPAPADAARLTRFLRCHPRWSVFWDKKYGVWRVAEDDPDSFLYAESRDLDTVISYITAHA